MILLILYPKLILKLTISELLFPLICLCFSMIHPTAMNSEDFE